MNYTSDQSETLPGRLSVSPSLPDSWVERLFQKFEDFYGSKWAAQYGDFPRERVKRTWAEELGGFADIPGAIAKAIEAQKASPFAPTLPEFLALCREAAKRIGSDSPALTYTPSPADEEKAKAVIAKAAAEMKPKFSGGIDTHWATHPRSEMHLRFIFDASKNDSRFKPCIAQMVSNGICTEGGKLLRRYRDGEFISA